MTTEEVLLATSYQELIISVRSHMWLQKQSLSQTNSHILSSANLESTEHSIVPGLKPIGGLYRDGSLFHI